MATLIEAGHLTKEELEDLVSGLTPNNQEGDRFARGALVYCSELGRSSQRRWPLCPGSCLNSLNPDCDQLYILAEFGQTVTVVAQFGFDDEQRKRLVVREQD